MADPIHATPEQVSYWTARDGCHQDQVVIGGREEGDDVIPCPALFGASDTTHVAYQLNELEVATLACGGTLWLTTWGGLPIHLIEVIPRCLGD